MSQPHGSINEVSRVKWAHLSRLVSGPSARLPGGSATVSCPWQPPFPSQVVRVLLLEQNCRALSLSCLHYRKYEALGPRGILYPKSGQGDDVESVPLLPTGRACEDLEGEAEVEGAP